LLPSWITNSSGKRLDGTIRFGWGTKICRAEADSLGEWNCVIDYKKYDSPLVFRHKQGVYLIGRRNLTETGNYYLGYDDLEPSDQTFQYLADYWNKPKRCSLWEIDPISLDVTFMLDFPSKGDTCFPGLIVEEEGLYQGSPAHRRPFSPLARIWVVGQTGKTNIYRTELTMP